MGAFDQILVELRERLDEENATIAAAEARQEQIRNAITALEPINAPVTALARREPKAAAAASKPKTGRTTADRIASAQKAAKVRVTCPDCGQEFSNLGLGVHRSRAHRRTVTPVAAAAPPVFTDDDAFALIGATG